MTYIITAASHIIHEHIPVELSTLCRSARVHIAVAHMVQLSEEKASRDDDELPMFGTVLGMIHMANLAEKQGGILAPQARTVEWGPPGYYG